MTKYILIILASSLAAGCRPTVPKQADAELANAALTSALGAWQQGATMQSLLSRTPPIHVSDAEWSRGNQLIEFEIKSGQAAGYGWRCDVLLTVSDKQETRKQHAALYRIDTDPTIVVVHEE